MLQFINAAKIVPFSVQFFFCFVRLSHNTDALWKGQRRLPAKEAEVFWRPGSAPEHLL